MPTYTEVREELAAKRKSLHDIFTEAGPDLDLTKVTSLDGDTSAKAAEIKRRNDELNDLGKQHDDLAALATMAAENQKGHDELSKPVNGMRFPGKTVDGTVVDARSERAMKTLGELVVESDAIKGYQPSRKAGPAIEIDIPGGVVNYKTVLTETGFAPQAVRIPRIIETALETPRVADVIPTGTTDQIAIVYMEETTATNSAAAVAEGALKPESALAFTERSVSIRKIATVLPITDEMLADVPAMRSYVEARMRIFLALAEDSALLVGSGVAPNIMGLLNVVGIQTQAKGADPTPDAVYKAMVKIATTAFVPASATIWNPLDWQDVKLLRTADGIYIWGQPMDMGPDRIWGLPVVTTTAMTQNTMLVGAFDTCTQLFRRQGVTFAISSEHSDFFQRNELMLRIEERLAVVCYRPAGLCTVTGV